MADSVMTGIRLTSTERDIVNAVDEQMGLQSFSAALRYIIRDWKYLSDLQAADLRVVRVGRLPGPEGARAVPVVYVGAGEDPGDGGHSAMDDDLIPQG